ncbi:MAG: response regulator transcription factor [Lachnospiraceae bacterium]|nr:response regulator transcription factor [Lachnospiraceae bacterium]
MSKTILIVEDNREINKMLSSYLKDNGYEVLNAYDGNVAQTVLKKQEYDLVLMDLMLPIISGEQLIKDLRGYSNVPVIVISAKSMIETRIEMLRVGADDYIIKPFDLGEVLVRIEAVLRRIEGGNLQQDKPAEVLTHGELSLYTDELRVTFRGENISLTSKEVKILEMLLRYPQKTFSKANLYEAVWNEEYFYEDNTINVHVSNLRNKLKKATDNDYVETVWGIGYRLKA